MIRPVNPALRALGVAAMALLAGCAAVPSKVDPLEPMNRVMYDIHDAADTVVMKPVAEAYTAIVPKIIRTGVSNAFNNLDDLFSALNGLLQGKLEKAGNDLGRVLLNTTWGMLGINDLASDLGIERGNEDFGQTFAVWGIPQGPYLFVPIIGPTTARDGTGLLVRLYLGPVGYIRDVPFRNSLYGLGAVDLRAQFLETGALVDQAALDKYVFIRNAYLQRRRYLIFDGKPPPDPEEE
jgi:phospholipid-binding lipoprotein MlaA